MHIAGCHDRLVELLAQSYNPSVDVLNILNGIDIRMLGRVNHKGIVAAGLDFQIVVKIHNTGYFLFAPVLQERPVQLSRFAGAADDKTVPVLVDGTLRYLGLAAEVF